MRDSVAVQKLEDETVRDYPHGLPVRPAAFTPPVHFVTSLPSMMFPLLHVPCMHQAVTIACMLHQAVCHLCLCLACSQQTEVSLR